MNHSGQEVSGVCRVFPVAKGPSLYSLTLPSPRALHSSRPHTATHVSGADLCPAEVFVGPRVHHFAALRSGNGGGDVSPGHISAGGGPGALECGVCAAFEAAHRRSVREQSVSAAALLSVPSLHQTFPP